MSLKEQPIWLEEKKKLYPSLEEDVSADVVIIGGGITGITSAYLLAKERKKVVLLEAKELASNATGYTTAFITQSIDTDLTDLVDILGVLNTKLVWQSHGQAIDLIEKIVKDEKIDCEFTRCSNFVYASDEKQARSIYEEKKIADKLGFDIKLKKENLGFCHNDCLEIKNQAKFHPTKYLYALAKKCEELGVKIFEKSEVLSIDETFGLAVKTEKHLVQTLKVIVTTYNPFNHPREIVMKGGMYESFIYELEVPKGVLKEGIYEDLSNPYYYFRVDPRASHDQVIIGGEDRREELKIDKQKHFNALKKYINHIFGHLELKIISRWTGPILEPSDGLASIGEYRPNQYLAAHFSGNGMTYSHISALIFRDIILGRKNDWVGLYNPKRRLEVKRIAKKALDYSEEFFEGVVANAFKKK